MFKTFSHQLARAFFHYPSFGAYLEPVIQMVKPNWRADSFRARVESCKTVGEEVLALTLSVTKTWPSHKPGQHIQLTTEINGVLVTRPYTLASSPKLLRDKGLLRLVIKQQNSGLQTNHLHSLSVGSYVNISDPVGDFVLSGNKQSALLLAAGSGITPFIAMISSLEANNEKPLQLLYYAKPGQHLLVDELEQLAQQVDNFSFILMTREQHGDVAEQLAEFEAEELYVCGPSGFYQSAAQYAKAQGVEIYSEHFSALPITTQDKREFNLAVEGKEIRVNNSSSLLEQLLSAGETVQYGCKMGICHQCLCSKKSGLVKNLRTGEISDSKAALIQLCVSQPLTDLEIEL